MSILALVRNYIPAHYQVINGEWDIARIASKCAAMPRPLVPASPLFSGAFALMLCRVQPLGWQSVRPVSALGPLKVLLFACMHAFTEA